MNRRHFIGSVGAIGASWVVGRPKGRPLHAAQARPSVQPLIIEVALNGGTPKSRNPHVARTPAEVAADTLRCLGAGAAIVHTHADDAVVGGSAKHDARPYVEAYRVVMAKRPDALLYPTMAGGGRHTNITERASHLVTLAREKLIRFAVVDTGTMNLGSNGQAGIPGPSSPVYENTIADIAHLMAMCEQYGLGPNIAVFESGFLRVALSYWQAKKMPGGAFPKLYFSGAASTWGLPPTAASLDAYLGMIGESGMPWAVAALGGDVVATGLARLAIERGGHVRVGLEDFGGSRKPSNEELVREVVALAKSVGRPVASCAQAAEILKLPRVRT